MTKKKILLTGDRWGAHQGTTVEATPAAGKGHLSAEGLRESICITDCPVEGWTGVEVPYLIGEKVRLTGDIWGDLQGDITTVASYDYNKQDGWGARLENSFWVVDGWDVEPVTENEWTIGVEGHVIETSENITDPNAPLPFITPKPDEPRKSEPSGEHPNFVQVSEKVPTLSSEYDKTYSAYREDEYSPWEILSTEIEDATDIKGLRKVLDAIEERMLGDKEEN